MVKILNVSASVTKLLELGPQCRSPYPTLSPRVQVTWVLDQSRGCLCPFPVTTDACGYLGQEGSAVSVACYRHYEWGVILRNRFHKAFLEVTSYVCDVMYITLHFMEAINI